MEDLLKGTQLEMQRLLQVVEEQRILLGAELMSASQRLQALKPTEMVSEYSEQDGSGAFSKSGSQNEDTESDGWDDDQSDQGTRKASCGDLRGAPTSQPLAMAEEIVDKLPDLGESQAQAPKRPSTLSTGSNRRDRRISEGKASPKVQVEEVARSPSNTSQNSQGSESVASDYSHHSDGSDASVVSDWDLEDDKNDKRKRRKKSRKSGQKKKNETIGILLNETQPVKTSSFGDRFALKVRKYIDHVAGALVLLNSFSMMIQLEMEGRTIANNLGLPQGHNYSEAMPTFRVVDEMFVWIFLAELLLRMFVEGRHFVKDVANWLDAVLVAGGLFDVILSMAGGGNDGVTLRFVSAMKAFRAIRMVRSFRFSPGLRMLVKACQCCLPSLMWSMLLLAVFMCMGALIMGNLLQDFIKDESQPFEDRQWVWARYGTTYRAMYTLYEITFAGNWPTNARPVLDKVSQMFVIFYLLYVTIIVFAVIRVISAIFLKDTLDEANNDAQQMVLERMRKKAEYVERLETTFHSIDNSEDGVLTESRLTEILANPKVKAYFATLEIDVQEGAALFHLLDNGDGEVTLDEFISGVMRCKGPAKAIDTFALQRDLSKLDHKVAALLKKCTEMPSFQVAGATSSLIPLQAIGADSQTLHQLQKAHTTPTNMVNPLMKASERQERKAKTTGVLAKMSNVSDASGSPNLLSVVEQVPARKVSV